MMILSEYARLRLAGRE